MVENRYAFLNDYRASEMADLRTTIKKTKDEGEKERLKKKLLSMESQEQTRKRKEEHQKVIRDHRKKRKRTRQTGKAAFLPEEVYVLSMLSITCTASLALMLTKQIQRSKRELLWSIASRI